VQDKQANLHAKVPRQFGESESESEQIETESNPENEGLRHLRKRQSLVSYQEPSLGAKLRQGDAHTFNSGNLYGSNSLVARPRRSLLGREMPD